MKTDKKAKKGPAEKPPKAKGMVTRFFYLGAEAMPEKKGYWLKFGGHRSDFPTQENAFLLLEVHTHGPPESWDPEWWPVAVMRGFNCFRHIALEDIHRTPPPGLPGLPKGVEI